jgi:hexokinase
MDRNKKRMADFLHGQGISPENIDMDRYCRLFLEEMKRGLEGMKSSLKMIPTFIEVDREIPLNKPVMVLDVGGTHVRVASVYFNSKGSPVIEHFSKHPMPGLDKEVGKEEFFKTLAGYVAGFAHVSSKVGFCFSYPTEILPNKNGKLLTFVKEVRAKGIEGELIGENFLWALKSSGIRADKHIVLLNDTAAALLAGMASSGRRAFDSYVGFILGTGTNCCYIEKNRQITKRSDLHPAREQIINVESGDFDKGPIGDIDRTFHRTTKDPGRHTFEKMISGAYLGSLCLFAMKLAADRGIFSVKFGQRLRQIDEMTTEDINQFLLFPERTEHPLGKALKRGTEDDSVLLYNLIDPLIERAAKLSAINISSAVLKSGKGTNPSLPVCITAEGSVYHGLYSLRKRVESFVNRYLVEKQERYVDFLSIDNATLIGAAIAGLTN